jgi:hypothetical protein
MAHNGMTIVILFSLYAHACDNKSLLISGPTKEPDLRMILTCLHFSFGDFLLDRRDRMMCHWFLSLLSY